jgi:hypothetical protein
VDYDYLKTFGVKLLEGREIQQRAFGTDTINSVVISQSWLNSFMIKTHRKDGWRWIAVPGAGILWVFSSDFHLYTLEEKLEPLTLTISIRCSLYYGFVKTASLNGREYGIRKKPWQS